MTNSENISLISNKSFWNSSYVTGHTGWDIGKISTPVKEYIDQITDKSISILIPGCGNAYEAEYLSNNGFSNITLIDISDVLVNNLKLKFSGKDNITVKNKDFFDHNGSYDLIIEQTFFCAVDPSIRNFYSDKMRSLLCDNGNLAGVLFDREFEKDGPPYGGSEAEYRRLFSKNFDIKVLEKCRNSIDQRSGSEVFINLKPKK